MEVVILTFSLGQLVLVNNKPGVITNIGKGAYAVNIDGTNEWFNEEDIISMYPKDSVQFYQGNLLDIEFKINQYLIKNNNKSVKQITATGSGNDSLVIVVYTNS